MLCLWSTSAQWEAHQALPQGGRSSAKQGCAPLQAYTPRTPCSLQIRNHTQPRHGVWCDQSHSVLGGP
eukprot:964338-Prymnesium_polylepis.1